MKQIVTLKRTGKIVQAVIRDGKKLYAQVIITDKNNAEVKKELLNEPEENPVAHNSASIPQEQEPQTEPPTDSGPACSQEPDPDAEFNALREKAKTLKVKGYALLKTADQLRKAIAKAEGGK